MSAGLKDAFSSLKNRYAPSSGIRYHGWANPFWLAAECISFNQLASMKALLPFIVLALGATLVTWLFLWFRYRSVPLVRQAKEIFTLAKKIHSQLIHQVQALENAEYHLDLQVRQLKERLFSGHLRTLGLLALADYPGIGPVTIDSLQKHGIENLAGLQTFQPESMRGFGPKRSGDLRHAVRQLTKGEEARFASAACEAGLKFKQEREALAAKTQRESQEQQSQIGWMKKHLEKIGPTLEEARKVTFFKWVLDRPMPEYFADVTLPPWPGIVPLPVTPVSKAATVPAAANPLAKPTTQTWLVSPATSPHFPAAVPMARPPAAASPPRPPAPIQVEIIRPATPDPMAARKEEISLVARFAIAVARADGRLAKAELLAARLFLHEQFGQEKEWRPIITQILSAEENSRASVEEVLPLVKRKLPVPMRHKLYQLSCRIADATGPRNSREEALLSLVQDMLELRPNAVAQPPMSLEEAPEEKPAATTEDPRKVLEFLPGAELSPARVREQWRQLQERFDPDKFSPHGEEFVRMAKARRASIEESAKKLLQEMGEAATLEPPKKDPRHNPDLDNAFGF